MFYKEITKLIYSFAVMTVRLKSVYTSKHTAARMYRTLYTYTTLQTPKAVTPLSTVSTKTQHYNLKVEPVVRPHHHYFQLGEPVG